MQEPDADVLWQALRCTAAHVLAVWLATLQATLAGLLAPPAWAWPVLLLVHGTLTASACYSTAWSKPRRPLGALASWVLGAVLLGLLPRGPTAPFWSTAFLVALCAGGWLHFFHMVRHLREAVRASEVRPCIQSQVDRALGPGFLEEEKRIDSRYFASGAGASPQPAAAAAGGLRMVDASDSLRRGLLTDDELKQLSAAAQLEWAAAQKAQARQ